ncbi:MAG: hypothetical protein QOF62_890 [Pyrinomonadaceae bacterium]|jgi:hypothetical protein|nr:hypothetical protein [Pyrinomonadaceae bacterium]
MFNRIKNSYAAGFMLMGLLIVVPSCAHRETHQVGSHKVTVSRHGLVKRLDVDEKVGTLEYAGIGRGGEGLKVSMNGDSLKVNGIDGKLRPGDAVLISDDGVAINSLDYGQSEKYLRANNSTVAATN